MSGRPTPTRTRWKSGPPSSCFSDFRPLWPARPPPSRVSMRPNGRSISSWITSTRSSGTPSAPRAGPTDLPGLVHVGLRQEHATRGPPGPVRALGEQAAVLLLRPRQLPALGELRSRPRSRCCGGCGRSGRPGCRARRSASRPCPPSSPPRRKRLRTRRRRPPRPRPAPSPSAPRPRRPRRLGRLASSPTSSASSSISRAPRPRSATVTVAMIGLLGVVEERRRPRAA